MPVLIAAVKTFCVLLLICLHVSFPTLTLAVTSSSISLSSGNEISYSIYPAQTDKHNKLILWFYSEAGPQASDKKIATELAKLGYETWLIDLFDSYFLPVSLSSMDQIPATDITDFINRAASISGKTIYPVSTGRSAIPLLRAKQHWQKQLSDKPSWPGMILISPKFYLETPDPGVQPNLMPIVNHSNSLLFIMQPAKSPWFWKLEKTVPALESNGSDVYLQRVAGVRDRFYFRPDADEFEQAMSQRLPKMISHAVTALSRFPARKRQAITIKGTTLKPRSAKKDKKLRLHRGNSRPEALKLTSLKQPLINLKQLKGKVVLVNFWATWCPPCVHEMPSMQRLQDKFSVDDFVILGVNMAEDRETIEQFLKQKVAVNFPILLDSDGAALKQWQVFAFPTSYVIDKQGQIRYSLFGSIEWDQADPVTKIQQLLAE